ncbi:MAG: sugar phosphate nucleotidyltransferase [Pseudomonadota bacterium]
MRIVPVILCGGFGTRLWPLSTPERPKPFLPLIDPDKSLLAQTLRRIGWYPDAISPMVVCGALHHQQVRSHLREAGWDASPILIESSGKNTAPAILAAVHWLAQKYEDDGLIIVMPADHIITGKQAFLAALDQAVGLAAQDKIVTFGCLPTVPRTEFGYIVPTAPGLAGDVRRFVEKPDEAGARTLIAEGALYNSGIFLFSIRTMLTQAQRLASTLVTQTKRATQKAAQEFTHATCDVFLAPWPDVQAAPIDKVVMEKSDRMAVVPANMGWDDVGSFLALWRHGVRDKQGNVIRGADIELARVTNSLIIADKPIRLVDMDGMVVIDTEIGQLTQPLNNPASSPT